jgi:outer membrane protein
MKKTLLFGALMLKLALPAEAAESWTLERAIRHALTNSPEARLALHRITAAQAGLQAARAAFSPQLQFQAGYLRTDNPMLVFGSILNQRAFNSSLDFNDVPDIDNASARGVLTMPLYAGGRNTAGRNAAQARGEAAKQDADAIRQSLAFEVARAFHTVLKTRAFIEATDAGARAYETNTVVAQKRLNAGTLLKADVLDVQVRLAQAREDLVRARNAHALALRALRNLLGLEQGELEVADAVPAPQAPASGDYAARAELRASQQRQQAAEAEVRRATAGYKPRLNAFGSLDYDYGTRTGGDGGSYTGGLLLQWDIWDGLLTKARREEARANLESTREEDRKLRLALDLELEQARLAWREADERLAVTAQSLEQAQESVSLTRARFEQGLALATQLIDAETALIAARVRRAEAEADLRIAAAAVRKALGLPQLESGPAGN